MPKRGRGSGVPPADDSTMRRQVVAARVIMPTGDGLSSAVSPTGSERQQGQGFGWGSLLSGLPGEPDDEDHEGWVERLFGNERSSCTSPPNAGMLDPNLPSPSKSKRSRPSGGRRAAGNQQGMMPGQAPGGQQLRPGVLPGVQAPQGGSSFAANGMVRAALYLHPCVCLSLAPPIGNAAQWPRGRVCRSPTSHATGRALRDASGLPRGRACMRIRDSLLGSSAAGPSEWDRRPPGGAKAEPRVGARRATPLSARAGRPCLARPCPVPACMPRARTTAFTHSPPRALIGVNRCSSPKCRSRMRCRWRR